MTSKKPIYKIIICCFLALALFLPFTPKIVYADTALTISTLISNHSDQEITNTLQFPTDFEEGHLGTDEGKRWETPTYPGITFDGNVVVQDFTSETPFSFGGQEFNYKNHIGTDGTENNQYGLLIQRGISDDPDIPAGLAGIESSFFTVPARAIYVLTFNVKVAKMKSNGVGINAKLISEDGKVISMASIKKNTYNTYAFLIRGNEFSDTNVKLQFLFGNVTEKEDGTYELKDTNKELGFAAIDTIRLFSVTSSQYADLASVTANTKANFYSSNPSYTYIPNGNFMYADNQKWDLSQNISITDFRPSNWTQLTAPTEELSRVAHYGIININPASFNARMIELGFDLANPGNPNSSSDAPPNNNVLLLCNETTTWQTITSEQFTLAKNSYYEVSFKFNTPCMYQSPDEETNSLSFYILDSNNVIYSSENMFSYTEHEFDKTEWATFRVFIKTIDQEKKLNFVIKFGKEDSTQYGYAYVDEVVLTKKINANTIFENEIEDTYELKTEEGEDSAYLPAGTISFADLQKLNSENPVNRGLSTYEFTTTPTDDDDDDDDDPPVTDPSNISYLWYLIPSILLGTCVIFGLVIFYVKRVKIKMPKKRKKNTYDRKKTLEKQVEKREKTEQMAIKNNAEEQLKIVRDEIAKLESEYASKKSNKMALKAYISKREKLQIRETKLLETINKIDK